MSKINIEEHVPLAIHIATIAREKTELENLDWDDLLGICYLGLCKAAAKFDPDRGIKFSTYAYRAIWSTVLRENQFRYKPFEFVDYLEDYGNEPGTWEEFMPGKDDVEGEVVENITREITTKTVRSWIKTLPQNQQRVLWAMLDNPDYSKVEISKKIGITSVRVSQILKAIREKHCQQLAV